MRWLFLLLIMLNVFFYVWHQQQAPLRGKEVAPLDAYQARQQGIQLLGEAADPIRRESAPASWAGAACLYLGGFDQEASARLVEQRLLSLDIQAGVRTMDVEAGTDYWVYLPPLASRDASLRQLRELQSRNIDSYLITVGDLSNGISLGIFSRKDSGEGVQGRLREAGYDPFIRELPRVQRKYWVRIASQSTRLIDEALLAGLARDMPALQQQQMPCEGIATAE